MKNTMILSLSAALLLLSACGSDEVEQTVDTEATAQIAQQGEAPPGEMAGGPGQGGPGGGAMNEQATANDSIIEIVEEVAADTTIVSEEHVVELAEELKSTLSDEELETLQYEFTEENAQVWTNLPANSTNRNGLALGDLSEESVKAALKLAKAALSEEGFETMVNIIRSDEFLTTDTGRTEWGSRLYYIAFLGEPSNTDTWMLQISGHHLAENIVYNGEYVSATPQFTGTEPQTFTLDGVTYSPIEKKRDAMYSMLDSLSSDQQAEAKLSGTFKDVVVGAGKDGQFPETEGLAYSSLTAEQQNLVKEAITTWVSESSDSISTELLSEYLNEEALSNTYISWGGSLDPNEVGAYARIDGPRVYIEMASQAGVAYNSDTEEETHFHTVWRDKVADYGGELSGLLQ
nr:DUF3500 domain-containing protein [Lysinibacillus timonensis]